MRKKILFLFCLLILLVAVLVFSNLFLKKGGKEVVSPPPKPPSSSGEAGEENLKEQLIASLPYFEETFSVTYFARDDTFMVHITYTDSPKSFEEQFKEAKVKSIQWFREKGLPLEKIKIEWKTS